MNTQTRRTLRQTKAPALADSPVRLPLAALTLDPAIQQRVSIVESLVSEYAADIATWIDRAPVDVFHDGNIRIVADGFHRVQAARVAGLSDIPVRLHQGDRRAALLFAVGSNRDHGLRRTNQDKRKAAETLLLDSEWCEWSDRRIADQVGVSHTFVSNLRPQVATVATCPDSSGEVEQTPVTDAVLEAERTAMNRRPAIINASDGQPFDTMRSARAAEPAPAPLRRGRDGKLYPAPARTAPADLPHLARNSGNIEWYTPAEYLDAAREVLGDIDLDPASNAVAQDTVQAREFCTLEDDGLARPWHGRVWLNPPYERQAIQSFADKVIEEWTAGNVTAAIVLTNNASDTRWFHVLAAGCTAFCLTRGRIGFISPEGEEAANTRGQAFFYFGPDPDVFHRVFVRHGLTAQIVQGVAA